MVTVKCNFEKGNVMVRRTELNSGPERGRGDSINCKKKDSLLMRHGVLATVSALAALAPRIV